MKTQVINLEYIEAMIAERFIGATNFRWNENDELIFEYDGRATEGFTIEQAMVELEHKDRVCSYLNGMVNQANATIKLLTYASYGDIDNEGDVIV